MVTARIGKPQDFTVNSLLVLLLFLVVPPVATGLTALSSEGNPAKKILLDALSGKHVLVVGGSGRVGGSVATQLLKRGVSHIQVGGTSRESFVQAQARQQRLFPALASQLIQQVSFVSVDRERAETIRAVLENTSSNTKKVDLVIHTAGPFQGKVASPNGVLEACVEEGIPYMDVCDDFCTASAAKTKYFSRAKESNTPCLLATGCWPGVSSLMAKQLVTTVLKEHPDKTPNDIKVDFSFFTAGSGGAGATLLVATFLILAEPALVVQQGRRRGIPAMRDYAQVDFGPRVGVRNVAHLNLLETASIADLLGVNSVQSRFGTAPEFWNALLGLMAQLPSDLLANEGLMRKLSLFSLPMVRLVDFFAGATNAMRCDVTLENNRDEADVHATAIYAHENLEPSVGECAAAFAAAILSGAVAPGVWFPEEAIAAGQDVTAVLEMASVGAHTTEANGSLDLHLSREQVWGHNAKATAMGQATAETDTDAWIETNR